MTWTGCHPSKTRTIGETQYFRKAACLLQQCNVKISDSDRAVGLNHCRALSHLSLVEWDEGGKGSRKVASFASCMAEARSRCPRQRGVLKIYTKFVTN